MKRLLGYLITVAALVAAAVVAPASGSNPTGTAHAADLQYFDPGNLISDAVFYDYLSMDVPDVQTFLDAKGANCTAGSLCLKNYTETTTTQAADSRCGTYTGASSESAATIIVKVARACGISPRVLLVTLQKESGLVTKTSPTSATYTYAMGYGCPDTTGCSGYEGLFNQVYHAAHAFQSYRLNPGGYTAARAGMTTNISYYPATSWANNLNNSRCGTESVYVANEATASLYIYTPYVPNQAALDAGYGTGDSCSSYGNRNFWNYFTDWFGSTQSVGGSAIYTKYQALGGSGGALGTPVEAFRCGLAAGGCFQQYQNGRIYWSPATGAWSVSGDQLVTYDAFAGDSGSLGYPVSDAICGLTQSGCYQIFSRSTMYTVPTIGTHVLRGSIRALWQAQGAEYGPLGYPTSDENYSGSGSWQQFQNGRAYWSTSTGAHSVRGDQLTDYVAFGAENGELRYPVSELLCGLVRSGCYQLFTGGAIYTSPTSGTHVLRGGIRTEWQAQGSEYGPLGYPTGEETYTGSGSYQQFENGRIYWSPATGAHSVQGAQATVADVQAGVLGIPTTDLMCGLIRSGCYQLFTGGSVYTTPATGSHALRGGDRTEWQAQGSEYGPLGYPTGEETYTGSGSYQQFENGRIYWSPATGARSVRDPVLTYWAGLGGPGSAAGYPVADQTVSAGIVHQQFSGGEITYDPATSTGQFQPN